MASLDMLEKSNAVLKKRSEQILRDLFASMGFNPTRIIDV
jgi:hypothetical protein